MEKFNEAFIGVQPNFSAKPQVTSVSVDLNKFVLILTETLAVLI